MIFSLTITSSQQKKKKSVLLGTVSALFNIALAVVNIKTPVTSVVLKLIKIINFNS